MHVLFCFTDLKLSRDIFIVDHFGRNQEEFFYRKIVRVTVFTCLQPCLLKSRRVLVAKTIQ